MPVLLRGLAAVVAFGWAVFYLARGIAATASGNVYRGQVRSEMTATPENSRKSFKVCAKSAWL